MTENQKRRMNDLLEAKRQRELEPDEVVGSASLAALIADDAYAMTFQSMGQYRTALLKAARAIEAEVLAGVRAEPAAKVVETDIDISVIDAVFPIGTKLYLAAPTTPAQVPAAEVRAQALEEAAKICDARAEHVYPDKAAQLLGTREADAEYSAAINCAEQIRSLAQSSTADKASEVRAAEDAPLNGIPATMMHDEGAIARCFYCGRYSLDRATLGPDSRQPVCECGKQHGWSGSFKKPDANARWSGAAPSTADSGNTDEKGGA